jgi:imidazolonepropionase-like amidohydrolase
VTPIDALRCATTTAAQLLGLGERIGLLDDGKLADIIGVDGDPFGDIKAMRRDVFLMRNGRVVRQPQ